MVEWVTALDPLGGHHGFLAGRGFNNRQKGMLQVCPTSQGSVLCLCRSFWIHTGSSGREVMTLMSR